MILYDDALKKLDAARAKYRRDYDQGYGLSERGDYERAQQILDKANADLRAAEAEYAREKS